MLKHAWLMSGDSGDLVMLTPVLVRLQNIPDPVSLEQEDGNAP